MVRNFFWDLCVNQCSKPFKGILVKPKQNKAKKKKDINRKRNWNLFYDAKTMNISPTRYIIIWKQSKESENESFTGKEGIQKQLECRAAYGSVVHKKERTQKP